MASHLLLLIILCYQAFVHCYAVDPNETGEYFRCVYLHSQHVYCDWLVESPCMNWTFMYGPSDENKTFTPKAPSNCSRDATSSNVLCHQLVENTHCYLVPYRCIDEYKTYQFQIIDMCREETRTIAVPINETSVQMEPVTGLIAEPLVKGFILMWSFTTPPDYYDSKMIICQVSYHTLSNTPPKQDKNITTICTAKEIALRVNDTLPGITYQFHVKCHPQQSTIWSKATTIDVMSSYTVPLAGPEMINSGFVNEGDKLIVYIKPPHRYLAQGNITKIKLELTDLETYNKFITIMNNTESPIFKICWTNGNTGYKLKASLKNDVGWSNNYTEVFFYQEKELKKTVNIITEVDSLMGTFKISFEEEFINSVCITYFWCLGYGNGNYVICKRSLQWEESLNSSYKGNLSDIATKEWQFGASFSIHSKSSGIAWTDCVFYQHKKATKPIPEYEIGHDFVRVVIPREFCDKSGYRPLNYILLIKKENECWRNVTVIAKILTTNITVTKLSSNTVYDIIYAVQYNFGTLQSAESKIVTLHSDTKSSKHIVLQVVLPIIVIMVFILTLLGVALFCFRKSLVEKYNALRQPVSIYTVDLTKKKDSNEPNGVISSAFQQDENIMIKNYHKFEGEGIYRKENSYVTVEETKLKRDGENSEVYSNVSVDGEIDIALRENVSNISVDNDNHQPLQIMVSSIENCNICTREHNPVDENNDQCSKVIQTQSCDGAVSGYISLKELETSKRFRKGSEIQKDEQLSSVKRNLNNETKTDHALPNANVKGKTILASNQNSDLLDHADIEASGVSSDVHDTTDIETSLLCAAIGDYVKSDVFDRSFDNNSQITNTKDFDSTSSPTNVHDTFYNDFKERASKPRGTSEKQATFEEHAGINNVVHASTSTKPLTRENSDTNIEHYPTENNDTVTQQYDTNTEHGPLENSGTESFDTEKEHDTKEENTDKPSHGANIKHAPAEESNTSYVKADFEQVTK